MVAAIVIAVTAGALAAGWAIRRALHNLHITIEVMEPGGEDGDRDDTPQ